MRAFAEKPKTTQQSSSSKTTIPGWAHLGQSREVSSIHPLQRTVGNPAVPRMPHTDAEEPEAELTGTAPVRFGHNFGLIPIHPPATGAVQTKLAINKPGDQYEQEADHLCEQVMRVSEPQLQRPYHSGGGYPGFQAEQPGQEQTRLQTKRVQASDTEPGEIPPIVHEVSRSPGQPLEAATRDLMESRFGHDFSHVRIHTNAQADDAARSVKALAYTTGKNIVFREGQYAPHTSAGRKLIAHELTHVIQQSSGGAAALQRDAEGGEISEVNESGGGREGGEAAWPGELMCSVMPNSWAVGAVRSFFAIMYDRALAHLDHYLSGAGGEFHEDIAALFRDNPTIAARIGRLIRESGRQSGTLSGTGRQGNGQQPPIRQEDCQERNKKSPNRRFKKSTLRQLKSPVRFFNISKPFRSPTYFLSPTRVLQCGYLSRG